MNCMPRSLVSWWVSSLAIWLLASVLLGLAPVSAARAEIRTWTSSDGRFSIEAELVEATETSVRLRKANGSEVTVPLQSLSEADRAFARGGRPADPAPADDDEPLEEVDQATALAAKKTLEERGLRATSAGITLSDEAELSRQLGAMNGEKRNLSTLKKQWLEGLQKHIETLDTIANLEQVNEQLGAQLATVLDAAAQNQIITARNANMSKIETLHNSLSAVRDAELALREKYRAAHLAYLEKVAELRGMAEQIPARYRELAGDGDVRQAARRWAASQGKTFELAPSRTFAGALNRLKTLEATVEREAIPVKANEQRALVAPVSVNGKPAVEMILDPATPGVCITKRVAAQLGIEISPHSPRATLRFASGRQIEARTVLLKSVKVGDMTAENVECTVLYTEEPDFPLFLGGTFFSQFQYDLDKDANTLTLSKLKDDGRR